MKVVILAAGRGSRLGETGRPKALASLENGQSILEHQLVNLVDICDQDQIYVVVGYNQQMIRDAFPRLHYVQNLQFAQENTSKSLLKALESFPMTDVLWLNGDVVFRKQLLRKLLEGQKTALLVNRAVVGEEEIKYRTDGHGCILEVSKQVQKPEGEAVGINYFARQDVPILIEGLKACRPMDFFEVAIEYAIQRKVVVSAVGVAETDCLEIDFPEDLALANLRLKQWNAEIDF